MTSFIQGLDLSRAFYHEAVKPIIEQHFPSLTYTVGLIGSGSEVLGYDTEMSSDHHWGPRLLMFLSETDKITYAEDISTILSKNLPYTFMGYSTHFGEPKVGEGDNGTQLLETISDGDINHRVEILTIDHFMVATIGIGADTELTSADWLSLPQQKLLSITAGDLFHDGLNIQAIRDTLSYYPRDVWLYLLASGWSRIGQDEHLAPRAGYVGDELGSAVIAGRLVRSIMQLCFLIERQYAPYPKWFGTAFAQLSHAEELIPMLRRVQIGETYRDREAALVDAYTILNTMHNALGITEEITPAVGSFHGRPFTVSNAWRYSEAIVAQIQDEAIKQLPSIGSIDQFSDNTDMREQPSLRKKISSLYD